MSLSKRYCWLTISFQCLSISSPRKVSSYSLVLIREWACKNTLLLILIHKAKSPEKELEFSPPKSQNKTREQYHFFFLPFQEGCLVCLSINQEQRACGGLLDCFFLITWAWNASSVKSFIFSSKYNRNSSIFLSTNSELKEDKGRNKVTDNAVNFQIQISSIPKLSVSVFFQSGEGKPSQFTSLRQLLTTNLHL